MEKEEVEVISVEDSIKAAMDEVEEKQNVDPPKERVEKVKEEEKEVEAQPQEEKPELEKETIAAPQSWKAEIKAEWANLPPSVQAEISRRETEFHKMLTRNDGELSLGREIKEVITPYMPIIQAEGSTPAKAVQSLLNTAYQLRTAGPAQKAALFQNLAEEYGVDLSAVQQQEQIHPALRQMMEKINGLENTVTQQRTLQEHEEQARIHAEVNAFSADPKNTYFEQVRAAMAPLLGSGQAKDMQEAYDMACWANPQIRSTLIAAQTNEQAEKRKAEVAKKKQAAVSITGSPSAKPLNSTSPKKSIEEELADVYDDVVGSRV